MMSTKNFYNDYYSQMSQQAWKWRELGGTVKAQNIAYIVGNLPIRTVLDVGSGTGAILAHLAHLDFGEEYYAVDIADSAVELVRRRPDIPKLVEAKLFDGVHIPYNSHQFDLAILSHVVEHINDPVPLLLEAARVARFVAVEVPLEDNLYTYIKVHLFKSRYREEIGHVQWFNRDNFRFLLERKCGLKIKDMKLVYVPDELYLFRKQGFARLLNFQQMFTRKLLRSLSKKLYTRLLTDHCIALVQA